MRHLIFSFLFVILASFCVITVYLYQHRGNVMCLHGTLRQAVQPTADAWYRETKEVVDFYQDLHKNEVRAFTTSWKKAQHSITPDGKTLSHSYLALTNTLFKSIQTRKNNGTEP